MRIPRCDEELDACVEHRVQERRDVRLSGVVQDESAGGPSLPWCRHRATRAVSVLSMERLELRADGFYEYGLRRPWSDGTVALVLKPMELMEKLCVLVPRPRVHLVRYHGVLAPNHRFRKTVVPPVQKDEQDEGTDGWRPRGGLVPAGGAYVPWALLLKRVWAVDILRCVVCGSRRVLIEVTEPGAVQQILCHLALDSEGPARLPARGPPDEEVA